MIPVPYHKSREKNIGHYGHGTGRGDERCLLCGKPVNGDTAMWVHVGDGGMSLVTEAQANADQEADMGFFPVGPDCWRRHPEIHGYAEEAPPPEPEPVGRL